MKKLFYFYSLILFFLIIFSLINNINVEAEGQLISIPTANIGSKQGYIRGVISANFIEEIEAYFMVQPALKLGGALTFKGKNNNYLPELRIKTLLVPETKEQAAIAAGLKDKDLYLVASKNLAQGYRGHLGLGNGNFAGLFIGVNKLINSVSVRTSKEDSLSLKMPPINLMAEYRQEKLNLGARFYIKPSFNFDLALINLQKINWALNYKF